MNSWIILDKDQLCPSRRPSSTTFCMWVRTAVDEVTVLNHSSSPGENAGSRDNFTVNWTPVSMSLGRGRSASRVAANTSLSPPTSPLDHRVTFTRLHQFDDLVESLVHRRLRQFLRILQLPLAHPA